MIGGKVQTPAQTHCSEQTVRMNARARVLASVAVLCLAAGVSACERPRPFQAPKAGADAADPGYRAAPQVSGAVRGSGGGVTLSGRALPSSQLRMVTRSGARFEARADGSGAWTAELGPVSEPALYNLAEDAGGRTVSAEGLIAVLPGAPTAALLRAGSGAQVVQAVADKPIAIQAVDYDVSGATVVSGRTRAASPVRVMVDGQPPIEGASGPDGRFSLTLPKPLQPGLHRLQAQTPKDQAEAQVTLTPPAPPKGGAYQAQAESYGWRVDWITPGGGAQTTLLLAGG